MKFLSRQYHEKRLVKDFARCNVCILTAPFIRREKEILYTRTEGENLRPLEVDGDGNATFKSELALTGGIGLSSLCTSRATDASPALSRRWTGSDLGSRLREEEEEASLPLFRLARDCARDGLPLAFCPRTRLAGEPGAGLTGGRATHLPPRMRFVDALCMSPPTRGDSDGVWDTGLWWSNGGSWLRRLEALLLTGVKYS